MQAGHHCIIACMLAHPTHPTSMGGIITDANFANNNQENEFKGIFAGSCCQQIVAAIPSVSSFDHNHIALHYNNATACRVTLLQRLTYLYITTFIPPSFSHCIDQLTEGDTDVTTKVMQASRIHTRLLVY
jgi:hypothetical protein